MLSIKARLVLLTMLSIAAIFGISGSAIYYFARTHLMDRFDQKLRIQAYSIMTATYQKQDRRVEVHFTDRFLHEFNSNQKRAFYQIWKNEEDVVRRSDSLGGKDLPREYGKEGSPKYWYLRLPNGLGGRAIGVQFEPRVRGNRESDFNEGFSLILVVATDIQEVETSLAGLRNLLLMGGLATLAFSPVFVFIALNRGLAPLQGLAGRMGKVDASSLGTHFDEGSLPGELRPIAKQLNELFLRLRNSFEREQQFNADVAHELRTPIAAMLNIAEVGLKWKESELKSDYETMRSIALEMQRTVNQLLDLSRADSGHLKLYVEEVAVDEVIREKCRLHQPCATERNLTISLAGLENTTWNVDRVLFTRIIDNLLENAVAYAVEGSDVVVSLSMDKTTLSIRNRCEDLEERDLKKLFDRFWRKDSARSSTLHRGLGLAIALAFAQRLDLRLAASLIDSNLIELTLSSGDVRGPSPTPEKSSI